MNNFLKHFYSAHCLKCLCRFAIFLSAFFIILQSIEIPALILIIYYSDLMIVVRLNAYHDNNIHVIRITLRIICIIIIIFVTRHHDANSDDEIFRTRVTYLHVYRIYHMSLYAAFYGSIT